MTRWYLVAAAGVLSVAPLAAQQGTLAPTAPVVPAPVLQGGNLISPTSSTNWGTGARTLAPSKWSPFRSPATASAADPGVASAASYNQPLPPLPAGLSGVNGACGAGACGAGSCGAGGHAGRDRVCWSRMKAWMCYHPSNTELPRWVPTPYQSPLLGVFPCSSVGGCTTGCATGCVAGPPTMYGPPPTQGPPMLPPMPLPPPPSPIGMMPPRGTQGTTVQPTWQARTTPAPTGSANAVYRYSTLPTPGPIVNTSLQYPFPAPK